MYFLGDLKERNLRITIYLNERNKTTTNGGAPLRMKHHNGRVERNVGHGLSATKTMISIEFLFRGAGAVQARNWRLRIR